MNAQSVIPLDNTRNTNEFEDVNRFGENNDEINVPNLNRDSSFEDITAAKVFRNGNLTNSGETPSSTSTHSPSTTTNKDSVTGKVDFVSFHTPTVDETTESQAQVSENVRLHQQGVTTVPQPCKQRSGVICEYGCLDDIRLVHFNYV